MGYRKIIVNDKQYEYTIGREFVKIKGMGVFPHKEIGQPDPLAKASADKWVVTPGMIADKIAGKPPRQYNANSGRKVWRCEHGVTTRSTVNNPYEEELFGNIVPMIDCNICVRNVADDI